MSHELDFTKGTHAFASFLQSAWHGLGTVIQDQPDSLPELLEIAGLDYEVIKVPNIHRLPNGLEVESKESFSTVRKDIINGEAEYKVLGPHVGAKYQVLQNEVALNVLDPLFQNDQVSFETAGAIKDGAETFVCVKLKDPIVVGKNDEVSNYIVLYNSHNGSKAITGMNTPIRVVCNNTLQMSFREAKRKIKIRHTASAEDRLQEASRLLLTAQSNATVFARNANEMVNSRWSVNKFFDYVGNLFLDQKEIKEMKRGASLSDILSPRKKNSLIALFDYAESGIGQKEAVPGTAWWAYNAVTGYYSNVKNFSSDETKFESMLFGHSDNIMSDALTLASPTGEVKPLNLKFNMN